MVCSLFLFLFAISQSDSGTLNYGSRWRAKKNMPEHIHWILPTCLYIIFTFAMTKNYLHTMLFVFGWSILFYRFNVVLTMRNREEALAHCRARSVYILPLSLSHCLHPLSYAANAIFCFSPFFCLLLLLVKGAVVSLLIRWTSLCGSSASVLKVYVNNSLLNYLFCSPKLFVELLLEMCIPMHDCYVHESTNISSQCCIITINLLNWITTVLA